MDRWIETEKKDRIECQIFQARFPSFFTFCFRSIFLSLALDSPILWPCRVGYAASHSRTRHTYIRSCCRSCGLFLRCIARPCSFPEDLSIFFSTQFSVLLRLLPSSVFPQARASYISVPTINGRCRLEEFYKPRPKRQATFVLTSTRCIIVSLKPNPVHEIFHRSSISPITEFRNEHIRWSVFYRLRFASRGFAQHAAPCIFPDKIFKNSRWHLLRHVALYFSSIKVTITQRCIDLSALRSCLIRYIIRCRFTRILRRLPRVFPPTIRSRRFPLVAHPFNNGSRSSIFSKSYLLFTKNSTES